MRRRSRIEPRRIIFIGVEGPSERAFVQLLARCCDDAELHLHLEAKPATGGDTLAIVEEAYRRLERHPARKEIKTRIVLLDRDRLEQDLKSGRDARAFASKRKIEIVFQEPDWRGCCFGCTRDRSGEELLRKMRRGSFEGSGPSTENHRPPLN